MTHDYLADLNQEQRRAVKHGVKDGSALDARPLLVIAGAGSGKTKTLAHRVAHLVVNGIDPYRILLLTFIPDSIVTLFDSHSWHERIQASNRPAKKGATTDVAASLRRMWR